MPEPSLYLDRYDISIKLGVGGVGEVWLAHDQELDEEVALKFLRDSFSAEEAELLKRETKQARALNHPHILRVYDFHNQSGSPAAISMEYVSGGDLAHLTNDDRPFLEVDEISEWIQQACSALTYAHEECGIVHRDIKPSNLMLDSEGHLKLADFGLASQIATSLDPESENVLGGRLTLHYASPQLIWNPNESHHLNDIFAFGVTVFKLLTGTFPFDDPKDDTWTWDPDNLLSISGRRKERGLGQKPVPEEWDIAIARCLAENPEDRPTSFKKLSEMLQPGSRSFSAMGSPPPPALVLPPAELNSEATVRPETGDSRRLTIVLIVGAAILGIAVGVLWRVQKIKKLQESSAPPIDHHNTL